MDFSSDSLRAFIEVFSKGSFTAAASQLHKTQSAVSTQIRVLEERAGLKLIDRSLKPMQLTEAGKIFLEFAKETVNKTDNLAKSFKEMVAGTAGEVKIGATTSTGMFLLPQVVAKIVRRYPNIRISMDTRNKETICEFVRQRQLDFGIIISDKPVEGLATKKLRAVRLCFVASYLHPLAKRKLITLDDLRSVPFAMGSKDNEYTKMVERQLEKVGFSNYRIVSRISNFESRKVCVHEGMGIAIMPEFTILDELQRKTLIELEVKGARLTAEVLLIESQQRLTRSTAELVKGLIEDSIIKHRNRESNRTLANTR